MRLKVDVSAYYRTSYDGDTCEIPWDDCIISRDFPWQPWILETEYGIGYVPGDVFDHLPVHVNKDYSYDTGNRTFHIVTKEIKGCP